MCSVKRNILYVFLAYVKILRPKTAVFFKRFTQATKSRHRCFQCLTTQPYLTSKLIFMVTLHLTQNKT